MTRRKVTRRRRKADHLGGFVGRAPQTEAAAQAAIAEATPELADSRCNGVMVLSFWEGEPAIPQDQFASHFLISPTLDPKAVAPFLRAIADELERNADRLPPQGRQQRPEGE